MAKTAIKAERLTVEEKAALIEAVNYRLSSISGHLAAVNAGMEREDARTLRTALKAAKRLLFSARKKILAL